MKSHTLVHLFKSLGFAVLISMVIAGNIYAAEPTVPEVIESEEDSETAEEIENSEFTLAEQNPDDEVVRFYGEKTLGFFRRQSEQAERDFWSNFNEYADQTKFKIKCRKEAPLGSRVARRNCYPIYLLNKVSQESNFARKAGLPSPTIGEIDRRSEAEKEEFIKNVIPKWLEEAERRESQMGGGDSGEE